MVTSANIRLWFWRFVRVAIAVFLGAACFNVLVNAIYNRVEQPGAVPIHFGEAVTSVYIHLNGDELSGSIYVSLSRDDVFSIQQMLSTRGSAPLLDIVRPYLPSIDVGAGDFTLERVEFELQRGMKDGSMRVPLHALRLDRGTEEIRIRITPSKRFSKNRVFAYVQTTDATVLAVRHPEEQVHNAASFETRDETPIRFTIVREISGRPSPRVADVVHRFDAQYVHILDPLVAGIMYSVPFLLLIALRRRLTTADVPTSGEFAPASVTMVVFFIGIGVIRAGIDFYQEPVAALRQQLLRSCEQMFLYTDGIASLGAAFVVWYWPLFAARRRGETRTASRATRIVFWVLFLASAALTAATTLEQCVNMSDGNPTAATSRVVELIAGLDSNTYLLFAGIATIFALAAITAEWTTGARAIAAAIGTAAVATMLELFNALTDHSNVEALFIMAVLAAPTLFAILSIVAPRWSRRSRIGAAILAAALIVLRPLPKYTIWWEPTTVSLIGDLAPALRLIAAWILIGILRDLSETGRWDVLEPGERDAGIILALTFLFMPAQQWLYITVSIVLGWIVLRYWIFVPRTIPRESDADAPHTIRDVIRLNEASSALSAMKKEMRGKLAKGEVPFHEYERHVRGMEALVDDLHARLSPGGDDAPAAVLSSGQPAPPWNRAMIGARYGFLLAVPWMALFLRNFHLRFAPDSGSEWVGALGTAVQVLGQWPLLGFFFGYFYPHLRGETGLSKALYLYLAVASPALAATALAMPASSPAWTSLSFWALQLFIHCMLLGLFAGDYETLRKAGLGWRHVMEVHNLGALAAWGSSLAVAIGAAATTYITSKGGAFIMEILQKAPDLIRP